MKVEELVNGHNFSLLSNVVIYAPDLSPLRLLKDGDVLFCKTDYVVKVFNALCFSSNSYTLITHCSDYPITERLASLCPDCIKRGGWWAQNVDYRADFLHPLPIGVENHDGPSKGARTDFEALCSVGPRISDLESVYCNVGLTHPSRLSVRTALRERGDAVFSENKPFTDYLQDLLSYRYVASPRGNGTDCHRTWEALYCGATPIVDKHFMFDEFTAPVIQVTDWKNFTLEKPPLISNMDILNIKYWKEKIWSGK